jgi:acyl-CoA synthetase (AMP-forming)/AMP-acid ligase II
MRSLYPEFSIPTGTLTRYVLGESLAAPEQVALVDGITGASLSLQEIEGYAARLAAGLIGCGLRPGQVVAFVSPNSIWYPVVFHGVTRAGCAISPVNPGCTAAEIAFQLRDCAAEMVITAGSCLDKVREAARSAAVPRIVIAEPSPAEASGVAEPTLADLLESGRGHDDLPDLDPASCVAAIPYSSGTTGLPKGVVLTHENLVANIAQWERMIDVEPGIDSQIAVLPFFHIYGLTCVMNVGLHAGIRTITMPRFDLRDFLRIVERERITRVCVAPPIVLALAKDPLVDEYDTSSLRIVLSGAAPLDADLAQACQARLGPAARVLQGYGMTELAPLSHMSPDPGREPPGSPPAQFGTIGYAAPGTECRIVDVATGRDVAAAEPGELWVRGPQVMTGYLRNPAATAETIVAGRWLRTGDIAVVSGDGQYRIVDRLKELIKYKGYQVAPAELEAILVGHPDIRDAAVVGRPDVAAGEIPVAFVVAQPGSVLSAGEVTSYVGARVAPHKRVRDVCFVSSIPRSASGKILRRELRARL